MQRSLVGPRDTSCRTPQLLYRKRAGTATSGIGRAVDPRTFVGRDVNFRAKRRAGAALVHRPTAIGDLDRLRELLLAALHATDVAEFEQALGG